LNNNKILRWLVRNALILVSVMLFLLSFCFYLDVESRRSESGSKKERNVSTGVEDID